MVVLAAVGAAATVSYLQSLEQAHNATRIALGEFRESTLRRDATQWERLATEGQAPSLDAELAAAEAESASDLAALRPMVDPLEFAQLSAFSATYDRATLGEDALLTAGLSTQARAYNQASVDPAFSNLDAALSVAQVSSASAARDAGAVQVVGSVAVFTGALLLVFVFFSLYRRWAIAGQMAEDDAAQRTRAVRALRQVEPQATNEATAGRITDALLALPAVDVSVLFGFVGAANIEVLAVTPLRQLVSVSRKRCSPRT